MTFFETMAKLLERYSSFFTEGIVNTLIIAAFAVLLGTVFGTLMATLRMCRIPPLRWLAVAYIEFIRGTPLMVQLNVHFLRPAYDWLYHSGCLLDSELLPVHRRYCGHEHE